MRLSALAFAAIAIAGPAGFAAADPCRSPDARPVTVAEVVDGDVIVLADDTAVRLAGIMAPRVLGHPDAAPAAAAREALANVLAGAETVVMVPVGEATDRYGRSHGHIFLVGPDGRDIWVEERLAADGHAIVIGGHREPSCLARLGEAEAAAIAAKAGLWGDPEFTVREARDPSLATKTGVYVVVEGRVASVGARDYMTFIDFGADYRNDFTVMVTPKLVEKFAASGVNIEGLAGRQVRVGGVIEESGGPAIRLRAVTDLRVLDE